MINNIIYTIGYAPHSIDMFVEILEKYQISAVVDVRSSPYSQFKSEFNREALCKDLKKKNISYVFLGDLCGARVEDLSCYVDGKVDYNLVAKKNNFKSGLNRIIKGMENYCIAIMCAEKDPITCHRTILICRNLLSFNVNIKHILANAKLEHHKDSERRLLKLHKLNHPDMFVSESQRLDLAYTKQGNKIAYEDIEFSRNKKD